MLRFNRLHARVYFRRAVHCIAIFCASACTEQCDDPLGPDFQVAVVGQVTLNGEPLPEIRVTAGAESEITSANGGYNMRLQSDSDLFFSCVAVTTAPYSELTAPASSCFQLRDGGVFEYDWNYLHEVPVLAILTPANGSLIAADRSITLRASLTSIVSLNGATPSSRPFSTWSSSLDGDIGTDFGSGLFETLSEGTHVLTVSYTDELGATDSDEVTVTVGAGNQPPVATILSPLSGSMYSTTDMIQFSGTASDPEDGSLTGASLTWSAATEGTLGTGESFTRQLSAGTHLVRLVAIDSQGSSDQATAVVTVTAPTGAGTIQGTVMYLGAPLANVPVTLSGASSATTTTDSQGNYSFTDLPAGVHIVTISPPPGTDIVTVQEVALEPGQTVTVNFVG